MVAQQPRDERSENEDDKHEPGTSAHRFLPSRLCASRETRKLDGRGAPLLGERVARNVKVPPSVAEKSSCYSRGWNSSAGSRRNLNK